MTETDEVSESDEKSNNILYCSPVIRQPFEPKQQLRCMFCMGKNCKHCGESAYLNQEKNAIPGNI